MINDLSNAKFLYLEDDIETNESITLLLKNFTKNVYSFTDSKEAFIYFENNEIDLIITDLEMPRLNGIEFIKKIRKTHLSLPIIVFTAYSDKNHLLPCVNLNIQGYLLKPVKYKQLLEQLSTVVKLNKNSFNQNIHLSEFTSYDKINHIIEHKNDKIALTKKESIFLELLIKSNNQVVTYETISYQVWEKYDLVMSSYALRTLVKSLKQKIFDIKIKNISKVGYKLEIINEVI